MIIFLDTNIVLDILLKRQPYFDTSLEAVDKALDEKADMAVSANCITDIFYIAKRQGLNAADIKENLEDFLSFVEIVSVNKGDILRALKTECNDLEDELQAQCALKIKADYIITRDTEFCGYSIRVASPKEFIEYMNEI